MGRFSTKQQQTNQRTNKKVKRGGRPQTLTKKVSEMTSEELYQYQTKMAEKKTPGTRDSETLGSTSTSVSPPRRTTMNSSTKNHGPGRPPLGEVAMTPRTKTRRRKILRHKESVRMLRIIAAAMRWADHDNEEEGRDEDDEVDDNEDDEDDKEDDEDDGVALMDIASGHDVNVAGEQGAHGSGQDLDEHLTGQDSDEHHAEQNEDAGEQDDTVQPDVRKLNFVYSHYAQISSYYHIKLKNSLI
jgi:hypothetical protein